VALAQRIGPRRGRRRAGGREEQDRAGRLEGRARGAGGGHEQLGLLEGLGLERRGERQDLLAAHSQSSAIRLKLGPSWSTPSCVKKR